MNSSFSRVGETLGTYDFPSEVQRVIGPALLSRGFVLDAVDPKVDEGGRLGAVVFYRHHACKVQIYLSTREGEVNAMIAPIDAPNEFGPRNPSKKWRYFTSFAERPEVPLEELGRMATTDTKSDERRLAFVRATIEDNFVAARDEVTGRRQ